MCLLIMFILFELPYLFLLNQSVGIVTFSCVLAIQFSIQKQTAWTISVYLTHLEK